MAERKLIDPNDFWDRLNKASYDVITYPDREMDSPQFGYYTDTIQAVLNQTKKVDAVEVVRCKDCRYCQRDNLGLWCFNDYQHSLLPDDFCSYGERKDND